MKAYVFPGQGAQFEGMGKELLAHTASAEKMARANEILGFDIGKIMAVGNEDALKQTNVTQPALFLHAVLRAQMQDTLDLGMVAGHSLGEFSALVVAGCLRFEDGLALVAQRAAAMQEACELFPSTMAAIVGLEDEQVEQICESIQDEVVVPANYNCPGQLVVSGTINGINLAVQKAKENGAKMAVVLKVGGAFHSPLMKMAETKLAKAIEDTTFNQPLCPVYQNVDGKPYTDPNQIKQNLVKQLTAPVRWTQTIQNIIADGVTGFVEVGGNGKVLKGMILRVNRRIPVDAI